MQRRQIVNNAWDERVSIVASIPKKWHLRKFAIMHLLN